MFQDNIGDFENLPWFTAVETFCHGHGHEELEHTDRQTLSNIIEKTVLPKITGNTFTQLYLSTTHKMSIGEMWSNARESVKHLGKAV